MTKQPEDWLDDVPGDNVEDEDDEIIWSVRVKLSATRKN